eukprot:4365835-Prorocentrum_lima.AAC.1
MPSHTPQLHEERQLLVEVAVVQRVHEVGPAYRVLDVLDEVLDLLLPDLPSVLVKEKVLEAQ